MNRSSRAVRHQPAGSIETGRLSDEILRDYVDGRLTSEARQVIADLEARDPCLRRRVKSLASLQGNRCPGNRRTSAPVRFLLDLIAGRKRGSLPVLCALSALLTGACLLTIGRLAGADKGPTSGPTLALSQGMIDMGSKLHRVLERMRDGRSATAGPTADQVVVVSTFPASGTRLCREFDIVSATAERYCGIACRQSDARWKLELLVPNSDGQSSQSTVYVPASSPGADLMAQVVERLRSGPSFDDHQVRKLIKRNWRHEAD